MSVYGWLRVRYLALRHDCWAYVRKASVNNLNPPASPGRVLFANQNNLRRFLRTNILFANEDLMTFIRQASKGLNEPLLLVVTVGKYSTQINGYKTYSSERPVGSATVFDPFWKRNGEFRFMENDDDSYEDGDTPELRSPTQSDALLHYVRRNPLFSLQIEHSPQTVTFLQDRTNGYY